MQVFLFYSSRRWLCIFGELGSSLDEFSVIFATFGPISIGKKETIYLENKKERNIQRQLINIALPTSNVLTLFSSYCFNVNHCSINYRFDLNYFFFFLTKHLSKRSLYIGLGKGNRDLIHKPIPRSKTSKICGCLEVREDFTSFHSITCNS